MEENEIVIFETGDKSITLPVSVKSDTVWLSANQMAELFERDEKTIRKHINNVFAEEEVERETNTQKMRVDGVKQLVPFYTLDVIISVGYRVKSKRGVEFRRWANSVLKAYWHIGRIIVEHEQNGSLRAEYGKAVLQDISEKLQQEFGGGFSVRNLQQMKKFYVLFPNTNALRSQLTWTHYRALLRIENDDARNWYMEECIRSA